MKIPWRETVVALCNELLHPEDTVAALVAVDVKYVAPKGSLKSTVSSAAAAPSAMECEEKYDTASAAAATAAPVPPAPVKPAAAKKAQAAAVAARHSPHYSATQNSRAILKACPTRWRVQERTEFHHADNQVTRADECVHR